MQKERVETWAEIDKSEIPFKDFLKKADVAKVALDKAKKLLDDASARQILLEEAAAKLEQAKSLGLADDADLKQAIATTKAKAEGSKGLLPGLEKGVADATTATDASQLALDSDRVRVKEIASKLSPIEQRLRAADSNFLVVRSTWQKAQSDQTFVLNQIVDLKRIETWLAASKAVQHAELDLVAEAKTLAHAKDEVAQFGIGVSWLKKKITDRVAARDAALGTLTQAKKERNVSAVKLSLLQNTLDSIDKSLALVNATEPLIAAKQTIQISVDALNVSLQSQESRCSVLDVDLSRLQKVLDSETGKLAVEQKELSRCEQRVAQGEALILVKEQNKTQAMDTCSVALQVVVDRRQKMGYLALTRPLSPEQLCLSVFQTTGVLKNYVAAESADLDKQTPMVVDAPSEQRAARRLQATRKAMDKLRSHLDTFADLYSSGVGQTSDEFFASPDQALYMSNGGSVFQWSAPSNNNVAAQVVQSPEGAVASKLLYRALLSREPTLEEQDWVFKVLDQAGDKKPMIAQELVWSMLTSSEFRIYP